VLGANKATVDEGSNITITLTTALLGADTSVGYTITGVSSADLNGASLTGSFLTGTTDSISLSVAADATTEGPESIVFTLDNGQDAITIPINDTSLNPTYSLTTSSAEVNEGDTINITLTTTDISNGTEIPYTITGVTTDDINDAINNSDISFVIVPTPSDEDGKFSLEYAKNAFKDLMDNTRSKYVLISYNSTGIINIDDLMALLELYGDVKKIVLEHKTYNKLKGIGNYKREKDDVEVKEFLLLVEMKQKKQVTNKF
jgi:hypothetical protein